MKKIYIIIPAFNEEKVIAEVIQKIQKVGFSNIVVVDDGSKDQTYQKIKNLENVIALKHFINRGQGAALQTGLEYIKENLDYNAVVTFDADGQHQPEDIQKIVQPILENKADIVLGSRFLNCQSKIPFFRKIVLRLAILFTNFISHIKLTDTHNGFRALGKKALEKIKISHRGMEHASDIIEEISKNNLRYSEIPVKILYTEYSLSKGQATSNCIKLGFKIIFNKLR